MSDEKKPFHNPFGGLAGLKAALPQGPVRVETVKQKKEPPTPAKAVLRLERKGRRGKEVTVVEQLDLAVERREEWLLDLKSKLGCGGAIEGTALVLQGDHRERAAEVLKKRGVKQVVVGN